jgi:hypothetical protein
MSCIDDIQVSLSSAVGAQYNATFFAYIAIRSIGMWFSPIPNHIGRDRSTSSH